MAFILSPTSHLFRFMILLFAVLTTHVKANHRPFLHLLIGRDGIANNAPCWTGQNGSRTTELIHGSQTPI